MDVALDVIRDDFAAFADANTRIDVSFRDAVSVSWMQADDERSAQVLLDGDQEPATVIFDGITYTYANFFASAAMADLPRLARAMIRSIDIGTPFVMPRLTGGAAGTADAVQHIVSDLDDTSGLTRLLFVTGDAGAGKSRLLMACALESARQYLTSNSGALLLYVNAQGRGLARLTEALAAETQDLRSNFTYHAVARLARLGLLHVVIDGFDELIGGQGTYEDAFGSLAAFVEELDGRGVLIAAARSAYFEQEFLTRVEASVANGNALWRLEPLAIAPWSEHEVREYVAQLAIERDYSSPDKDLLMHSLFSAELAPLRSKPFFVAKVCELLKGSATFRPESDDLMGEVVREYVSREVSSKLVDSRGESYLSVANFLKLLEEVAEEMWRQEAREIHTRNLRDLFDLFAEVISLSEHHRRLLWEQATSRALLRSGRKPSTISFEHELFFGYFLATYLSAKISSGPQAAGDALSRGNIPIDAAQQVFRRLDLLPNRASLAGDLALAATRMPRATSLVRQNAGVLLVEFAKHEKVDGRLRISECIIGSAETAACTFKNIDFLDVEFHRADLRGTTFLGCTFTGCSFAEVKVSSTTRFEESTVTAHSFSSVMLDDDDSETGLVSVFDPRRVGEILVRIGVKADQAPRLAAVSADRLELINLIMREFRRSNLISDDPESYPRILRHASWPVVSNELLTSGLLVEEARAASGRKKRFFRRTFATEEFMEGMILSAHVAEPIRQFWDRI